jgi:amidase
VLPHPPVLRALDKVLGLLAENGNTVVPWTPYKHDYAVDLTNQIFAADGCKVFPLETDQQRQPLSKLTSAQQDTLRELEVSGEPAIPNIKDLLKPDIKAIGMTDLWDVHSKKWKYQMEYLEQWRAMEASLGKELDAIIAPITPTAAVLHNEFRYYGYASVVNLLDLTSVVVPVTFADKDVDAKLEGYRGLNEEDATIQSGYDPVKYHGAPVGIQIIGRRLSEERTLAIAEEIGRLLGNSPTL